MVKLNWVNKSDKNNEFEFLKAKYKNYFEKIDDLSSNNYLDYKKESENRKWINKLFWSNNLEVAYNLLNSLEEKIDLIYIDPPFYSGVNYDIEINHEQEKFDTVAYYDKWNNGLDSYLQMLYELIILFKRLLSKKGLLFIHLDWHAAHYIRVILDEVFGSSRFINSIIWYYYNKYSAGKKNLPRAHDDILVYSKSNKYTLNEIRLPRDKPIKQLKREMVNGVLKNAKDEHGHVIYRIVEDKKMDDVWKIPCMQPASKEWTGFPTQKHHDLLERIITIGSNKGDLIADFFCGSGTTLFAAEKLSRRWIGCDISEYSIYLTRKRINNLHKKKQNSDQEFYPFETYASMSEKKKKIIDSGFFNKDLKIKRKK